MTRRSPPAALALLGCGQIGGSLALALGEAWPETRRIGVELDAAAGALALQRGLVHALAGSVREAVTADGVELVLVAVPSGAAAAVLGEVAAAARPGLVVTDVGSTKRTVVAAGEAALGGRFVGGHPMAGSERSGPEAATAGLFRGRRALVTPTGRSDADAVALVRAMWTAAGAEVVEVTPELHDELCAAVSHLPHLASYALTLALAELGGEVAARMPGLYAGGFLDTTRIASSDPHMWREVFLDNRDRVLEMASALERALARLRGMIEKGDGAGLEGALETARAGRERILAERGDPGRRTGTSTSTSPSTSTSTGTGTGTSGSGSGSGRG